MIVYASLLSSWVLFTKVWDLPDFLLYQVYNGAVICIPSELCICHGKTDLLASRMS